MPSDFETLYLGIAVPAVFGLHGEPVTYAGDDGAAASVTAVVGPEGAELLEFPGERVRYRHRSVEVLLAEVPSPPRYGHAVTITGGAAGDAAGDAEVWTVRTVDGVQAGKARLTVTRPERVEQGGRRSAATTR